MGLAKARRLRGRSLSSSATASRSASVIVVKSVPLGKYWRSSPLVFSLEPRCHGACGSQKKIVDVGVDADLLPVAHLGALVPGQRATQRRRAASGSCAASAGRRARACSRRAARRASRSRWCARPAWRSRWRCACRSCRSPSQWPGTARSSASAGRWLMLTMSRTMRFLRWPAWRPGWRSARPVRKQRGQLATQRAPGLHVQRLIDRLRRHPHLRVIRELAPQPPGDLLGRVAPQQIVLHELAQRHVDGQLGRLGAARALIGERVRRRRAVAATAVGVATQLARDRRRRPPQAPRDHADRLPARACERDLLTLSEASGSGPSGRGRGAGARRRRRRPSACPACDTCRPARRRR